MCTSSHRKLSHRNAERDGLAMAEPLHEAGEPPCVEMFGVLELVLSSSNATGYKDVYKQKGRKKRPFQAKIYRTLRKDFINLGKFATAHTAAVAVAQARLDGIEDLPSPDKSRAESSTLPRPALSSCLLSLICCCSGLVCGQRSKSFWPRRPSPNPRLLCFKALRIPLIKWQSRSCSRGRRPRAHALLQHVLSPLRSPRSRLQSRRRQCRALWATLPTEGDWWVVEPHLGHTRGT
jgi:hypothetical protein